MEDLNHSFNKDGILFITKNQKSVEICKIAFVIGE